MGDIKEKQYRLEKAVVTKTYTLSFYSRTDTSLKGTQYFWVDFEWKKEIPLRLELNYGEVMTRLSSNKARIMQGSTPYLRIEINPYLSETEIMAYAELLEILLLERHAELGLENGTREM